MAGHVTTSLDGRIATVTIDRPEKLHALNRAVLTGLTEAFTDLPDQACVAILRTTGDRAFIAGADMNEFQRAENREEFLAFQQVEREANLAIANARPVVIAAVDGVAFGGGFEVALACDLIVAGEGVEMGFPEVKRGLTPGATGGAQWLPRLVGLAKAIELIATGDAISAQEGHRLGLVNRIAADGDVLHEATALAESMATNAPLAITATKRICRASAYDDLATVLSLGTELTGNLYETADAREGVEAFFEDREPQFEGR